MTPVDLDGASVLVVGATGGLGSRLVRLLAARGARLTLGARTGAALDALAGEVPGSVAVPGDLRRAAQAGTWVRSAVDAHGQLDVLVVAAGVVAFGPATEVSDVTLVELFDVNVAGPARLVRAAVPHLAQSAARGGPGVGLTLSGVVAEQPMAGMAAYSASKAALHAFVTATAREVRRQGVRLVDARPGHTETGLAGRAVAGSAPTFPRGLSPDDVAARLLRALEDGERDLPPSAFG